MVKAGDNFSKDKPDGSGGNSKVAETELSRSEETAPASTGPTRLRAPEGMSGLSLSLQCFAFCLPQAQ